MAAANGTASEHPFNYVDEDTAAQLRNVGSRVRKSVTEGFQRTVSVPSDPSWANKRLPFTQTPSFISSNDVMRDIFAQRANTSMKGSSSAPSSPQQHPKRAHNNGPDEDGDVDAIDDQMNVDLDEDDDSADVMTASAIRAKREASAKVQEEKKKREIRPLRKSASRAGATQSLPASMFRFSHQSTGARPVPSVTEVAEEDDWSGGFGTSGGVPAASLEL